MRAAKSIVNLLADLIATHSRARPHDRHYLSVAPNLAQRTHTLLEHPSGKPTPAGVKRGHGAFATEHNRDAIGGEHHRRDSRSGHRVAIGLEAGLAHSVGLEAGLVYSIGLSLADAFV